MAAAKLCLSPTCSGFTTNGPYCEPCRLSRQRAREHTRPTSAQRGYGSQHQRIRRALLADLAESPGQPCPRCQQAMWPTDDLDLGHADDVALGNDPNGPRRLEHRRCNRAAGGAIHNHRGHTP